MFCLLYTDLQARRFFEKSTRWSSCTAVARRFLISNTRSCESASRVKHSVSCHQTRALRIKIGGNITSHQQLHKPCKVTSRRVLSQKARGVRCANQQFRVSVDYGRVRLQAMVLNRLVIQASMPTSSVFVARVVFMASFVSSCAPVFAIIATVFARHRLQKAGTSRSITSTSTHRTIITACSTSIATVCLRCWKCHACHATSGGAKSDPIRRQASADVYGGTESTTPATQIEPEVLKVSRLPRKIQRRQIRPNSSPSFRGHLWRQAPEGRN